ncbi:MAG: peptidase M20 [Alphaproteobacteria bacterium]|jgi:amidohydrolase|nr:peptidase M20 [Alphaproteobacteria bacterium]|tara:strand:- start:561 stop:1739 length:1179 start_codon:yes stop_codon:yes gene_type:complete
MKIRDEITRDHALLTEWRRDFHAHPELAFEEERTSALVAERLESFGVEVHRGLAKTGVVGQLTCGTGNRAIALRADMDALPMQEGNDFEHASQTPGKMHGCGHDGHTTMLLGAAKYLAETKQFDGTVYFVFQPAEEAEGGAEVMVKEGLFEKFPVEAIYGMHNWPGMPVGEFAVASGPMMAAFDIFDLTVRGRGSHGAMPHQGVDSIVMASELVGALQSITSRNTDPIDALVVSVTQIHGGDAYNVIPDDVVLRGTVRSFREEVRDTVEPAMRRIADGICAAYGGEAELHYEKRYPATVNSEEETELAAEVATAIVGGENIERRPVPSMGSEDFAYMLREKPGSYVWVGNGEGAGGCMLHNPGYDFNDEIIPIGVSYWSELVEQTLPTDRSK